MMMDTVIIISFVDNKMCNKVSLFDSFKRKKEVSNGHRSKKYNN